MAITRRTAALCGVAGPVAFVGGWLVNGLRTDGYDPVQDAISQLARDGAATQLSMSVCFVVFGVLVPLWAPVVARLLDAPALRWSVTVAGLATVAVAALPLTREPGGTQDLLHAVAAGTGYVAMAVTPLLAAAVLPAGTGVVSACALVATVVADASGLFQRLGLTVVGAWHVVVAAWVLTRRP